MVRKTVAELLVDVRVDAGVERAYGLPGNSLNGSTDSMPTRNAGRRILGFGWGPSWTSILIPNASFWRMGPSFLTIR
jgi:hypothetical protein